MLGAHLVGSCIVNRAEIRAKYPFPRFPESWPAYRRRSFWVLSTSWLAAALILPNWIIGNDSIAFAVSLLASYAWWRCFPWRWSVAQGSAIGRSHDHPTATN
jgi:hypothetical protein